MTEDVILKVENISKQYRLGLVGTGTLSHDLNRWWHAIRGKENPYLKVGELNDRSTKGSTNYVWALHDISFEVKKGEVLGIIGKNGAGKSTLLKILSKVTGPTTGEIKTKGRIASLLEVGTGFHPELTGRENIYLNGAILGMTKSEISSKIDEIVEFSGCQRYIDTPTKRYSSGMTVRLAFAVAAHLEPEILIIDEVLAVGDAEFQKKAIGKMQDISKGEGRTVLFVSHNMAAVKNLCTRGLLIENGKIGFSGTIDEVVDEYLKSDESVSLLKDLNEMPRKTSLQNIMKRLELMPDSSGEIISGKKFRFRLYFEKTSMKELTLGYLIKDEKGATICAANMHQYGVKFEILDKEYIDVLIENLPLNPGKYSLSLYLGKGSYDVDIIEEAIFFQVFWNDDLGIITPQRNWGNTHVLTQWHY